MPDIVGTLKPPRLATPPSSPALGQLYYDTATNILKNWNGTAWVTAAPGPQGPQGIQGIQGPQGPPGDPATIPGRLNSVISTYIGATASAQTQSGWYYYDNNTTDRPSGSSYGYIHVYQWSGVLAQRQVAYEHESNKVWQRIGTSPWIQISPIDDGNLPTRLKFYGTYIGDLNAEGSGWCDWSPSTTNRPTDAYGIAFTIQLDGSNARQWAWQYNAPHGGWWRYKSGGTWTSWYFNGRRSFGLRHGVSLDGNGIGYINFTSVSGPITQIESFVVSPGQDAMWICAQYGEWTTSGVYVRVYDAINNVPLANASPVLSWVATGY